MTDMAHVPHVRIWQAVLVQAIRDLRFPRSNDPRFYAIERRECIEAHNWFQSPHCKEVCELAGVDYKTVMRLYRSGELEDAASLTLNKGAYMGASS